MSIASYEDVKNVQADTFLIDVREKSELEETGVLPNSINIPLGQLEDVLKSLSNDDFKLNYGRSKPQIDETIIFSCKAGGRALKAVQIASNAGYNNLSYYKGSWLDWAQKSQQ